MEEPIAITELKAKLREILSRHGQSPNAHFDPEASHIEADEALLDFIGADEELRNLYASCTPYCH